MQSSQQHVALREKRFEWGLGTRGLRMVAEFWAGILAVVTQESDDVDALPSGHPFSRPIRHAEIWWVYSMPRPRGGFSSRLEQKNIEKKKLKIIYVWRAKPPQLVGSPATHTHQKGLSSQASSDAFGLHPPSQLVIGYHWLAFLNQFRKNL